MKSMKNEQQQHLRANEKKWTKPLLAAGWTLIPSVILERQRAFGLDAVDLNILLQLARYWWFSDNPPHPSKQAIAECMNVSKSTVQRRIARLEAAGLIQREPRYGAPGGGQQTNAYHFDGLIKEALPFAEEAVAARRARQEDEADRRTRKRPKLALVPSLKTPSEDS